MSDNKITADTLWDFIESSRRVTGKVPRLRECVEHFDGKLLNVMLCLTELSPARADTIRQAVKRIEAELKRNELFEPPPQIIQRSLLDSP